MQQPNDEETARARWIVIQAMRVLGVVLVILGILMSQGRLDLMGDLNGPIGYFFVGIGLLDAFIAPVFLARRWKTPGE